MISKSLDQISKFSMKENEVNRKIAVIFETDVVGYSTVMEEK